VEPDGSADAITRLWARSVVRRRLEAALRRGLVT
jgi:hypothetical protein